MAEWTQCPLFLVLVVFTSLTVLSFYQWDMLQVQPDMIHQWQEQRKQQLRDACDSFKKDFPTWNRGINDTTELSLRNLIEDNLHGIIYCYVPKVACTNWKRVMFVLRHGEPYRDPMSLKGAVVHYPNMINRLKSNPEMVVKAKMKHYTKFLFVRDPFVRLISAYRDKFLRYNKSFYDRYGRLMLRRYGNISNPPQTAKEMLASGVRPSFHHFIKFLLDQKTEMPMNPHWRPVYQMCHPCVIQYDFIGHQETLQEDAEELLKMLKLHDDIKFPVANLNVTTHNFLSSFFKSVPIEDRRKLYQIYEMDFKLFGYPKPVELLGG